MTPTGFEQTSVFKQTNGIPPAEGAKSGTSGGGMRDLAAVWDGLTAEVRAEILRLAGVGVRVTGCQNAEGGGT